MKKSHVIYIFVAVIITTGLVILVWTNYGKIRAFNRFLDLLEKNDYQDENGWHIEELPETSYEHTELKCNYDINDFNDIINSIIRILDFLRIFVEDSILDAAMGTRVLEGQLQLVLQSFSLPAKIKTQLEQLLTNVTDVNDHILGHFVDVPKENDQSPDGEERKLPHSYLKIENGSLWEMPKAGDWQNVESLDLKRYVVEDDNRLTLSDIDFSERCIGYVFENCLVADDCFTSFLGKRHSENLITHAILFLLFAKKFSGTFELPGLVFSTTFCCHFPKNCFAYQEYMEKIYKIGDPNDIMASFCAKIFIESQTIDMNGFYIFHRDLFCEQVLVCSMSGFQQFLQLPWLRTILSWQNKDLLGCFELPKHDLSREISEEIYGIKNEGGQVKRDKSMISNGEQLCSAHFTGVALASISVHLRYLIESCGESLFQVAENLRNGVLDLETNLNAKL